MMDLVLGNNVRDAVYVDGQEQRDWFRNCLLNAAVLAGHKGSKTVRYSGT